MITIQGAILAVEMAKENNDFVSNTVGDESGTFEKFWPHVSIGEWYCCMTSHARDGWSLLEVVDGETHYAVIDDSAAHCFRQCFDDYSMAGEKILHALAKCIRRQDIEFFVVDGKKLTQQQPSTNL